MQPLACDPHAHDPWVRSWMQAGSASVLSLPCPSSTHAARSRPLHPCHGWPQVESAFGELYPQRPAELQGASRASHHQPCQATGIKMRASFSRALMLGTTPLCCYGRRWEASSIPLLLTLTLSPCLSLTLAGESYCFLDPTCQDVYLNEGTANAARYAAGCCIEVSRAWLRLQPCVLGAYQALGHALALRPACCSMLWALAQVPLSSRVFLAVQAARAWWHAGTLCPSRARVLMRCGAPRCVCVLCPAGSAAGAGRACAARLCGGAAAGAPRSVRARNGEHPYQRQPPKPHRSSAVVQLDEVGAGPRAESYSVCHVVAAQLAGVGPPQVVAPLAESQGWAGLI